MSTELGVPTESMTRWGESVVDQAALPKPKDGATREGYGAGLAELAANPSVVVLDADLSKSTQSASFKKAGAKDRFFNLGIAEQNMMGVAAGLASCGKIVFASSFAIFATQRALNQVFQSICYPRLDVKIGATHAGVTVGEDGATHQAIDDIATMRCLPNMTVIVPADYTEARLFTIAAAGHPGPVYLRFGRAKVPGIYADDHRVRIGKADVLRTGKDVTVVACGVMVAEALKAAEMLAGDGIGAEVINCSTIKPLDKETILASAAKTGAVVTAEEHSVFGGLGGAVAEVLAEELPTPMSRVGVMDVFGQSGTASQLLKEYDLTAERIARRARETLARKKI